MIKIFENKDAYLFGHDDHTFFVNKNTDFSELEDNEVIGYFTSGEYIYRVLAGSAYGMYILKCIDNSK
jgi:hypothetical protein